MLDQVPNVLGKLIYEDYNYLATIYGFVWQNLTQHIHWNIDRLRTIHDCRCIAVMWSLEGKKLVRNFSTFKLIQTLHLSQLIAL